MVLLRMFSRNLYLQFNSQMLNIILETGVLNAANSFVKIPNCILRNNIYEQVNFIINKTEHKGKCKCLLTPFTMQIQCDIIRFIISSCCLLFPRMLMPSQQRSFRQLDLISHSSYRDKFTSPIYNYTYRRVSMKHYVSS